MPKTHKTSGTESQDIAAMMERLVRLARAAEHGAGINPAQWEALRYFSRCNRFSNSPSAATRYIGATKGTISQSIKVLERKGLVTKMGRSGERRSVTIQVTAKGYHALEDSPWSELTRSIDRLGNKTRKRMAKGLRSLLGETLAHYGHHPFGSCTECRHFHGQSSCAKFKVELSADEIRLVCASYSPG